MVHSQQRFWWTISPRKLYLICGVKVGKCQLLVAKCCQYQTLFCMTVTSKKWFNLFSRWRSRRACRRGDLFSMCQDHQSTHWIIPLLHPFMFLSPCTQGFGRSEALHKVHYGAIYSFFFFERKYFCHLLKSTVTAQMSFSLTGVSTSKATSADVSASLIHLFASFSPLVEILQGETFCLFPQNATQQFTSGASKKSLASAPGRRPTVATLWWAKLMFQRQLQVVCFNLLFLRVGSQCPAVFEWLIISKWHLVKAEKKSTQWQSQGR